MNKCDCWHKEERIFGWCGFSPLTKTVYECYGTKEREECHCMGDRGKCDFYQEVREKAMKDNGCEYCNGEGNPIHVEHYTELCDIEVAQDMDNLFIVNAYNHKTPYTEEIYFNFKVNFCPMCGRDLRKD